jgi:hypothetical protein
MSIEHVMSAAEAVSAGHGKVIEWLKRPLATFGSKTTLELVAEGHTHDVIGYLQSCESGCVG